MNYNAFSVDYMTKAYNQFSRTHEMLSRKENNKEFSTELVEKYEKMKEMAEICKTSEVSAKNMSMEEYKKYIHDKISQIPLDPSQSGWIWNIQITEEGFEAMKNDPEYEAYVLDAIRANFSFFDAWHSKNWSVLHFGAAKEECYGQSYLSASAFELKPEETFWERRLEKKKKMKKQLDKFVEKKKLQEKEWQETSIQRKLYYESIAAGDVYPLVNEQMLKMKAAAFFDASIIIGNNGTNEL